MSAFNGRASTPSSVDLPYRDEPDAPAKLSLEVTDEERALAGRVGQQRRDHEACFKGAEAWFGRRFPDQNPDGTKNTPFVRLLSAARHLVEDERVDRALRGRVGFAPATTAEQELQQTYAARVAFVFWAMSNPDSQLGLSAWLLQEPFQPTAAGDCALLGMLHERERFVRLVKVALPLLSPFQEGGALPAGTGGTQGEGLPDPREAGLDEASQDILKLLRAAAKQPRGLQTKELRCGLRTMISDDAIHRAIKRLREAGFVIDNPRNRSGYWLRR